jgi:hypothetical protein
MESLKIILLSVATAILYGIVHDQITVRICAEYFTVFHPPLVPADFPASVVALAWGVVATWWVGAILGIVLALASRAGSRPGLTVGDLLPSIVWLLLVMAACSAVFGCAGFMLAKDGIAVPPRWIQSQLPSFRFPNFMADWWAHSASYAAAFLGGITICFMAYRKRRVHNR